MSLTHFKYTEQFFRDYYSYGKWHFSEKSNLADIVKDKNNKKTNFNGKKINLLNIVVRGYACTNARNHNHYTECTGRFSVVNLVKKKCYTRIRDKRKTIDLIWDCREHNGCGVCVKQTVSNGYFNVVRDKRKTRDITNPR